MGKKKLNSETIPPRPRKYPRKEKPQYSEKKRSNDTTWDKEREDVRLKIAELYLRGYRDFRQIAKVIGMPGPRTRRDLEWVLRQWRIQQQALITYAKSEAIAKLDRLERQCWDDYERSKEDRTRTKNLNKTKGAQGDGAATVQEQTLSVEREASTGDPRFLQIIQRCIQERNEIVGLHRSEADELSGREHLNGTSIGTAGLGYVGQQFPTLAELKDRWSKRLGELALKAVAEIQQATGSKVIDAMPAARQQKTIEIEHDQPPPNGSGKKNGRVNHHASGNDDPEV